MLFSHFFDDCIDSTDVPSVSFRSVDPDSEVQKGQMDGLTRSRLKPPRTQLRSLSSLVCYYMYVRQISATCRHEQRFVRDTGFIISQVYWKYKTRCTCTL